jgi:DNA-directed RNA polymerase specialized sigma24 family protein
MSREQSAGNEPDDELRLSGVRIHDIGQRLIDLGEQLVVTGKHTDNRTLRKRIDEADQADEPEVYEDLNREVATAIRRTLTGLNSFRREYGDWERLVVEYALTRGGFTQRDVASLLGVGLSTVNRWAQHPLAHNDD